MVSLKDFDYELPRELVATYPAPKRSEARLLVLNRKTGRQEHRVFKNLTEYLQEGDLLVLNNTKVLPARLYGLRPTGGRVEALLLRPLEDSVWEMLVKPSGRIKKGTRLTFGENGIRLEGEILDEPDGKTGIRRVRFVVGAGPCACPQGNRGGLPLQQMLNKIGRIPLPPYIDRPDEPIDRELYQTVFAEAEGAVASPTAGLHFDRELLDVLRDRGIEICFITLHVSYGTFQPVQTEDLSKHQMYEEEFEITDEAADQIRRAKKEGRRIVACGTTVVRTLESAVNHNRRPASGHPVGKEDRRVSVGRTPARTCLFIYPPYEFQMVDAMITNFHVPRSTLLMLVCAFVGRDLIFRAYKEAIRERYRFYSYGDAMLIL